MLHESETWCLRENEMAILRRTERAVVIAKYALHGCNTLYSRNV